MAPKPRTPAPSARTVVAGETHNPLVPTADPGTAVDEAKVAPAITGAGVSGEVLPPPLSGTVVVAETVNPIVPNADPATAVDPARVDPALRGTAIDTATGARMTAEAPADTALLAPAVAAIPGTIGVTSSREDLTIVVTGPPRGRRRAGRYFDATAVRIPATDLTDDDLKALQEDPLLAVSIVNTSVL